MSDVDRTITTLQNLINGARNKGLKTTTVFTSTLSKCMALLKEHEELKSRHNILVDECDKMYSTLKEKNKTIEELEDDLATTKDMLNHYLNGNE